MRNEICVLYALQLAILAQIYRASFCRSVQLFCTMHYVVTSSQFHCQAYIIDYMHCNLTTNLVHQKSCLKNLDHSRNVRQHHGMQIIC